MGKERLKKIPERKIKAVNELANLIETKRTILISDISNIPGSQFQQIGKKLRGKAIVKVPKKNLLLRALDETKKEKLKELKNYLIKPVALLFSDMDSYELAGELIKNKSPAKAKPGQIAQKDLEIPAGPTDLVPGPAISELGALGIQIKIQGGKIEIKEPKVIVKAGNQISKEAAAMLSKLGIMPFTIGFKPLSAYDSKEDKIYYEIVIDPEGTLNLLVSEFNKSLAFAIKIEYFSPETLPFMIQDAERNALTLKKLNSDEEKDEEKKLKEKETVEKNENTIKEENLEDEDIQTLENKSGEENK